MRRRRMAGTPFPLRRVGYFHLWVLHLYAVVEHTWTAKHQIFLAYLVVLLGILAAVEPYQVHDAGSVTEVSHYPFAARPHFERLEA